MKSPQNLGASVRQRLLNQHRIDNRPFDELLQYFAMERFLYRLACSSHAERFILKGALLLRAWGTSEFRPTMDIDFLGKTSNDAESILAQIRDILAVEVEPDGLIFDPESLRAEAITEEADYRGTRVLFRGYLGGARINMQIDIGFSDVIFPDPEIATLPTLLNFPAPRLLCYCRESSIAEKFNAMISLEMLNSRMKDFYDIWLLSRHFDFKGETFLEAVRRTFENRETHISENIVSFSPEFSREKQIQWSAFRRRMKQVHMPESFAEVTEHVAAFMGPIVASLRDETTVPEIWRAPGPWSFHI